MRKNRKFASLWAFATIAISTLAQATAPQDGEVDNTWGGGGKISVGFNYGGNNNDDAAASVVGPDGSLYIAGTVTDANGLQRMGLTKLKPNGQVDIDGFGSAGRATSDANYHATSLALHNNTLYVGGWRINGPENRDFAVCVFSMNGLPLLFQDKFASCVTTSFGFIHAGFDDAYGMVVQSDGKILLAGRTVGDMPETEYAAFARFTSGGDLDDTFGQGGSGHTVLRGAGFTRHLLRAVTVQPNGKILAVGSTVLPGRTDLTGLVITLTAAGLPDNSVPEAAVELDGANDRNTVFYDVVAHDSISEDDDAVVVGYTELVNDNFSGVIAQLRPNGFLDTADFNPNGNMPGANIFTFGLNSFFRSIVKQPGAGYVVAGFTTPPGDSDAQFFVRRYLVTGVIDQVFGQGTLIDFPSYAPDQAYSVSIGGNGIFVAGTGLNNTNADFLAAKLVLDRIFADGFE